MTIITNLYGAFLKLAGSAVLSESPYVPSLVCPTYNDGTKSIYEFNNLMPTSASIQYNVPNDKLDVEVCYACENKLLNEVHGETNEGHFQVVCDGIDNAEIKQEILNVIPSKFGLDELDYQIDVGIPHEDINFNNIIHFSFIYMYNAYKIQLRGVGDVSLYTLKNFQP